VQISFRSSLKIGAGWKGGYGKMNIENLVLIGLCTSLLLIGCAQNRERNLGINKGQLTPCPDSPNCVSSQSADERHRIEPFNYELPPPDAMAKLKEVISSMERARIVKEQDYYLHAEFRSALFGFVDDVEFYLEPENSIIHVRSASRSGYYDFGVNRRRAEAIRSKLSSH